MVRLIHSADSKAPSTALLLQQLHGLVRQEEPIIVAVILSPMHLCLVSGNLLLLWSSSLATLIAFAVNDAVLAITGIWTSWAWHQLMIPKHTADRH